MYGDTSAYRWTVSQVYHAAGTFLDQLAAVGWTMLAIGFACHLLRLVCRGLAWRNILVSSFPGVPIRRTSVVGAYIAGVGANSVLPARTGDLLKLVLVRQRVPESNYATLTSTLLVETLFDIVVAGAILIWALTQDVLPALDVLPHLPSIDWHWPAKHPLAALLIAIVWIVVIVLLVIVWSKKVEGFKERVRAGFAILHDPKAFFLGVVAWQAVSWVLRAATVFFFLRAFHLPATAYTTALVLVVQSLSTLLPFTPGGIGTQQGLIVYVFRNQSIQKTLLVSFSVGMQIALTVFNVLIGLFCLGLMARTLRWKQVIAPARQELEHPETTG